jgi:4-hydroxybenzoate polyprenyltransferase
MRQTQTKDNARPGVKDYLAIARFDHWFKNVFMVPGVVLSLFDTPQALTPGFLFRIAAGFFIAGLVVSSNYIINEIIDAPFDLHHPVKRHRPIPSGRVKKDLAWLQWGLFSVAGLSLSLLMGREFFACSLALWVAGLCYNVPPLRLKEIPYLDVVSESVNNPIRLGLGWFATGNFHLPTLSLILAYWMIGAFFMAVKRMAEYRHVADEASLASYRKSFRFYNEERLLGSIIFYSSSFAMFYGIFMIRYHIELICSIPFIAAFMGAYLHLGFLPDSPTQYPEKLYHQKWFVAYTAFCCLVLVLLLFADWPLLDRLFAPLHLPE